jgi:hypothetical protein
MGQILEELLTQKRLAEKLDQSERTLERWRVEGTGPAFVKAGRRVLYLPQDVDDWLLATRRQSTSSPGCQPSADKEPSTEPCVGQVKEDTCAAFYDEEACHGR